MDNMKHTIHKTCPQNRETATYTQLIRHPPIHPKRTSAPSKPPNEDKTEKEKQTKIKRHSGIYYTGNHPRPQEPNNTNREQITEQRPKQYKQGSILAFTNIRPHTIQTSQTETQNN
eukprot:scaffold74882_cov31-Attheya_sp.AAC.1